MFNQLWASISTSGSGGDGEGANFDADGTVMQMVGSTLKDFDMGSIGDHVFSRLLM